MSELLGVTVEDLVATMKRRRVRIPSEIGAFIALEVCDALLDGPAHVRGADLRLGDDGSISVFAPPGSATSEEAARSVVAVLGSLLVAAGTGVPRALVGLLERGPSSGRWDLPSLRDDLEASLVPLNRAAARRVLGRMLREVKKPRSSAPPRGPDPAPQDGTLDDQLDDLLSGGAPASSRPQAARSGDGSDDLDQQLDATLDELIAAEPFPSTPAAARPEARQAAPRPPPAEVDADDLTIADDAPLDEDAPSGGAPRAVRASDEAPRLASPEERDVDLDALARGFDAPRRGSVLPWLLAFVAILTATAAALALMRPDLVDAMLGRPPAPAPPSGPTAEDQEALNRAHRGRFGTLTVTATPADAQILMYVGRGPAVAEELPLGVAIEFVAIADGRRPSRTVLPANADWEVTEDGRRYELAMQAGEEPMPEDALDLGPTRLPEDVGTPSSTLGHVRVITNPRGAKVYLLVGFSPSATVENVRTDQAVELLVYAEGHPVLRSVVGPTDWQQREDGSKHLEVSLALEPTE